MDVIPPIESIQYLVDVFIEGGYAEDEDLDHLDAIHYWLRDEEKARDAAFKRRINPPRNVNPDYDIIRNMAGEIVSHVSAAPQRGPDVGCYTMPDGSCADTNCGWSTEARPFENPAEMDSNRVVEDGPIDPESPPENRSSYTIVDNEGNEFTFSP